MSTEKNRIYWGIIGSRGVVVPHAISFYRNLAIKRFLNDPQYGFGGTWQMAKRRGWRAVRLTVTPLTTSH